MASRSSGMYPKVQFHPAHTHARNLPSTASNFTPAQCGPVCGADAAQRPLAVAEVFEYTTIQRLQGLLGIHNADLPAHTGVPPVLWLVGTALSSWFWQSALLPLLPLPHMVVLANAEVCPLLLLQPQLVVVDRVLFLLRVVALLDPHPPSPPSCIHCCVWWSLEM